MGPSILHGSLHPRSGAVTGHYTTFIWGNTSQLGCGVMASQVGRLRVGSSAQLAPVCNGLPQVKGYSFNYLVCDYYPNGGRLGVPVYR